MSSKVLITAIGPIAAIGIGRDDFFSGLDERRNGVRPPDRVEVGESTSPVVAECLDFYVEDYLESEKTYLDRASELLLAGCHLALTDGGLDARAMDHERIGLSIGTAYGCLGTMADYYKKVLEKGAKFASTVLFSHSYANTPTSLASIEYGIMGPTNTVCSGHTSGAAAIAYACDLLQHARTDAMLAGGMDALCQPLLEGLERDGYLTRTLPRPFDAARDGYAAGEGASLLLLERDDVARSRGARPLGELRGYGMAHGGREAVATAVGTALDHSGLSSAEVGCVLASASGHREADALELQGLVEAFGDRMPPLTSLKGSLGETFAAAAGLSAIAALYALQSGDLPPTAGLETVDPALAAGPGALPVVTPGSNLTGALGPVLVTSLDPGGNCACLVVAAASEDRP